MEAVDEERAAHGRGVVCYDFLYCRGGAEHVTLTLAAAIPGTDVCVGFRNPEAFTEQDLQDLRCIELGRMPRIRFGAWRTASGLGLFARRARCLAGYDWAVFSGSNAPVAVRHRSAGGNVYYCHTLPRFAYDLRDYYLATLPLWRRPAFEAMSAAVRALFEAAVRRMDVIVANSENVRRRIQRYLGLDARVVYPPCDVSGYRWLGQDDYYLSAARLESYKRVDLAVRAFLRMPDKRLVVASGGSQLARLQRLANGASNIVFVGWLDGVRLRELVGRAIATLYLARDEDFGIAPVESMAAGKPVIGVAEGGLLETVLPGSTGILLPPEPEVDDVVSAVRAMSPEAAAAMRAACEERARAFDTPRFVAGMRAAIEQARACGRAHRRAALAGGA
ncbi:MAG TPA: glycosyltransferase [Burkholderiales bacterium]